MGHEYRVDSDAKTETSLTQPGKLLTPPDSPQVHSVVLSEQGRDPASLELNGGVSNEHRTR